MYSDAELDAQRRNTEAFIAANPVEIILIPRVREMTGSGVRLVDQTPRASQMVRLIDQSSVSGPVPGTVLGADGQQHKVTFQMLGTFEAVFGVLDYWEDAEGIRWEIATLLPDNGYEQRAQVIRYGQG